MACVPLIGGQQDESEVEAWLESLEQAGALVILKRRIVDMLWGCSAAWTLGLVYAPPTDAWSIERYGAGPKARGVHLQERQVQHAERVAVPHKGGTIAGWQGRRVTHVSRVWAQAGNVFQLWGAEGPPSPLGEAPNGWRQSAYEKLAHAVQVSK